MKKGCGKKYVGMDDVEGCICSFDRITFSDKERKKVSISLTKKERQQHLVKSCPQCGDNEVKKTSDGGWCCRKPPCDWYSMRAGGDDKAMSAMAEGTGGALVPPPKQPKKINKERILLLRNKYKRQYGKKDLEFRYIPKTPGFENKTIDLTYTTFGEYRMKAVQAPIAGAGVSYFAMCPRDSHGRCLPKGQHFREADVLPTHNKPTNEESAPTPPGPDFSSFSQQVQKAVQAIEQDSPLAGADPNSPFVQTLNNLTTNAGTDSDNICSFLCHVIALGDWLEKLASEIQSGKIDASGLPKNIISKLQQHADSVHSAEKELRDSIISIQGEGQESYLDNSVKKKLSPSQKTP